MNSVTQQEVITQSRFKKSVETFYPGYFALIMATGILSISCHFLGFRPFDIVLFYLNCATYVIVWILTLLRLFFYRKPFWGDLTSHLKGPTFFTAIAATSILGSQFSLLTNNRVLPLCLWVFAVILWVALIYLFFLAVTVKEPKPSLELGLSGAWLILVVSTQSISVLASLVSPEIPGILFFGLCMFLLGSMLYFPLFTLIIFRWTFFAMSAVHLSPPYWINMGAIAITTLAGSRLILSSSRWALLEQLLPFLTGFTLLFWVTATWWIPLLLLVGAWRHLYKRYPIQYDPQYWGMVFPLGMYTTATFILGKAMDVPFTVVIASKFIYVAILAWALSFIGLLNSLSRLFFQRVTNR